MNKRFLLLTPLIALFLAGCQGLTTTEIPVVDTERTEGAFTPPPEGVSITKELPDFVSVREPFEIKVIAKNEDSQPHKLMSIDFGIDMIDQGLFITDTNPPHVSDYGLEYYHVYDYLTDIPANSEMEIVFTAELLSAGDYSGELNGCFDVETGCVFNSIRVIGE